MIKKITKISMLLIVIIQLFNIAYADLFIPSPAQDIDRYMFNSKQYLLCMKEAPCCVPPEHGRDYLRGCAYAYLFQGLDGYVNLYDKPYENIIHRVKNTELKTEKSSENKERIQLLGLVIATDNEGNIIDNPNSNSILAIWKDPYEVYWFKVGVNYSSIPSILSIDTYYAKEPNGGYWVCADDLAVIILRSSETELDRTRILKKEDIFVEEMDYSSFDEADLEKLHANYKISSAIANGETPSRSMTLDELDELKKWTDELYGYMSDTEYNRLYSHIDSGNKVILDGVIYSAKDIPDEYEFIRNKYIHYLNTTPILRNKAPDNNRLIITDRPIDKIISIIEETPLSFVMIALLVSILIVTVMIIKKGKETDIDDQWNSEDDASDSE